MMFDERMVISISHSKRRSLDFIAHQLGIRTEKLISNLFDYTIDEYYASKAEAKVFIEPKKEKVVSKRIISKPPIPKEIKKKKVNTPPYNLKEIIRYEDGLLYWTDSPLNANRKNRDKPICSERTDAHPNIGIGNKTYRLTTVISWFKDDEQHSS